MTGSDKQVFQAAEEIAVKMGDVEEKVFDQAEKGLLGFYVFLPAHVAVRADYYAAAIQAVLAFSLGMV